MAKKIPQPKKPKSYGKESGTFSKPHPVQPGACKHCGAYPPCTPKSTKSTK